MEQHLQPNKSFGGEEDTWEPFRNAIWEKALKIAALPATAQAIPVTKFCPSYLSTLGQPFNEVDSVCLAVVFSDHGEQEEEFPTVTKKQLELFLKRFGPPERSLIKIRDLLQNGKVWFHGKQSRVASERLLAESKTEGSFLLRYSSLEGAFTVDYIKQGKICHFNNIKNDPQGGVCVFVGKTPETQKAYKFTSMAAFISKNSHIFVVPCLNPRSHFQWLKLRIPKVEEEKAEASSSKQQQLEAEPDENEADSQVPVEEKVKNAIQNSFRRNKTTLSLRNIGIGPSLPTHICNLTYVVFLDLGKNKLTELPEDLKNLKSLKTLNVSSNRLTSLPSVIFTQFPRLTSLLASENEISHIPDTIFTVQTLNYIDLSQNKLSRISGSIGELAQLDFLDLGSNCLTEIPPTIGKLEKLEELVLKQNQLRALPPQVANLQSLVILDVSDNQISHLPKELLDVMMENARFGINTNGNPLAREDEDVIKRAKLRASQMKGEDSGAAHHSRDILGLLQIPQDKDKTWSRAVSESKKKKMPAPERGPENSLWVNAFGFVIEEGQGFKKITDLTLQEHINYYDYHRYFYQKTVHANIIGNEKHLGAVCISIQKEPMALESGLGGRLGGITNNLGSLITPRTPSPDAPSGYYRVLIRTKQGDRRLEVNTDECRVRKKEQYARSDDLLAALKRMLKPTFSPKNLYVIRDHRSHREFAELEDKLMSNSSKFGLIYATNAQDETQMYNNEHGSPEFEEFLDLLGDKIDMKDWPHYRGDLSNKVSQKSLYTRFKEHEIMFHVSTYLPFQQTTDEFGQQIQRKRYIGNDIVVIVYYEGETPIDPNTFVSNFNHVFAMVQPVMVSGERHYRLHMAYKVGVAESKPRLPEDAVFSKTEIKEFLLTKLINAERCAMSATQFRRPQEHVRSELFKALQEKFPKQTMSTWSLHRSKTDDPANSGYHSLTKEEIDKLLQTAQNQKGKEK